MSCPICQSKLEIDEGKDDKEIKCSVSDEQGLSHYYKYIENNRFYYDEVEQIYLFPFKIKNIRKHFFEDTRLTKNISEVEIVPARTFVSCNILKYNSEAMVELEYKGGYQQIVSLSHHIHPDTEDKLRERIKLILLLS